MLTLVRLLICLQIQRIPYGTISRFCKMVDKNELAMSISMVSRGAMIACTSGLAAAVSGETLRGRLSGIEP